MLVGLGGVDGRDLAVLLVLDALVDEHRGVTAVVQDHVRATGGGVRPGQGLLRAPPVLLQGLALPGEDRDALGVVHRAVRADRDGGGGVVLGGEDVAGGPADLGAQGSEGLDEHGGLHGHVQGAGDTGAGEGLRLGVLLADRHQAGHLVLGESDLLAAEVGQGKVGDLEVLSVVDSGHTSCSSGWGEVGFGWSARRRARTRAHGAHECPVPCAAQSVGGPLSLGRPVRGRPTAISSDVWLGYESTPIGPVGPSPPPDRQKAESGGPPGREQGATSLDNPGLLNFWSCAGVCCRMPGIGTMCASSRIAIPHNKGVRRST